MKVKANGISINYEMTGSGPCLTLIHGAADNLNAWYNQVPVFSKHYQVLTYDVRGHGQTEFADEELTSDLWVLDLYGLLQALNIQQTFLLGHSMGGGIALNFTLIYPEMVKALILSNSSPVPFREKEMRWMDERRRKMVEAIKKEGMQAVVKDRVEHMFTPGFAEKNPDTVKNYRAILLQSKPEGYLRVLQRMTRTSAMGPDLNNIQCPTLIIAGEKDPFGGPEAGEAARKSVKGAQLKIFPTGHAPALEVPEEYNETILNFLAGVAA